MEPVTEAERHDAPRLVDETVPGMTAEIDDVGVGSEYPVGQPVVAQGTARRFPAGSTRGISAAAATG